jgi:hypothetical protein
MMTVEGKGVPAVVAAGATIFLVGLWWGFERVASFGADARRSLGISAQGNDGGVGVAPGAFRIRFRP